MQVEGRAFPVEIEYRPVSRPSSPEAVAPLLQGLLGDRRSAGHVLVFLPGMAEIRRVERAVEPLAEEHGCELCVLHGSLPAAEQDRALRPSTRRKIILATNVAETSLTIDGVTTVIDSGLARVAHHDPQRGFDRLEVARISQASADQRAGRAGRTGPGRCVRLWSEREQRGMAAFQVPEVHRVDLCGAVLALHAWGARDARAFGWFDPPAPDRLEAASRLLTRLGALGPSDGRITPLGRQILDLPVHPRLARLLLASVHDRRCDEGAALAALLSEKDIMARGETPGPTASRRRGAAERGRSDLLPRLSMLAEAEHERFSPRLRNRGIDPAAARQAVRVRDELFRLGSRLEAGPGPETRLCRRATPMTHC